MHKIPFSKTQYLELLKTFMVGSWVRGAVFEMQEKEFDQLYDLEEYILSFAKEFGLEKELVEKYKDKLIPGEKLAGEIQETIEEYGEDAFWNLLNIKLGQRDFFETITPDEEEEINKDGLLPKRVYEFYKKYDQEFEENDIDNLRIISPIALKKLK